MVQVLHFRQLCVLPSACPSSSTVSRWQFSILSNTNSNTTTSVLCGSPQRMLLGQLAFGIRQLLRCINPLRINQANPKFISQLQIGHQPLEVLHGTVLLLGSRCPGSA
mgnify:CR=1 FL=1